MPGIAICNSPILSSGALSAPPFVVSDTPNTLLWMGSYDPANATLHTQPENIDARGTFDTDAGWTKGTVWTIANGVATTTGTGLLTATSTTTITFCRYSLAFDVTRVAAGTVRARFGGYNTGTVRSAVGSYTEEGTVMSTTGLEFYSKDGDLDIDNVRSFTNKSIRYYTPKYLATGLTGKLGQATADFMPYVKEDGIFFNVDDANADFLSWDGAIADFKCFTDGSGATLISCVTLDYGFFNGSIQILRVGTDSTSTVGCSLYMNQFDLRLAISNGTSSRFNQTVSHDWASGTYVFTLRVASGTGGVTCRVNKVSKIAGTLDTFSSANPTTTRLAIGIGGRPHTRDDLYIANRVLTDAECEAIENDMYLRATGSPMP